MKLGRFPGHHFFKILVDFGSQVGAKLGRKIEPRQAKTGQDRPRQGKRREGKGKEEEGKGLEGKGVKVWNKTFCARGGGVCPTIRGGSPSGSGTPRSIGGAGHFGIFWLNLVPFLCMF